MKRNKREPIALDGKQRETIVDAMEYLSTHASSVRVEQVLERFRITFDEYRVISDLTMPVIHEHQSYLGAKAKAVYYKTLAKKMQARLIELGEPETKWVMRDEERRGQLG